MRKTPNNISHIFIHFFVTFFLAYNSVVFQRICRKLVTVRKILKRSLKWDQSGISSLIRLKVISKTRLIVQKMGKIQWPVLHESKKCEYFKKRSGKFFALIYHGLHMGWTTRNRHKSGSTPSLKYKVQIQSSAQWAQILGEVRVDNR